MRKAAQHSQLLRCWSLYSGFVLQISVLERELLLAFCLPTFVIKIDIRARLLLVRNVCRFSQSLEPHQVL